MAYDLFTPSGSPGQGKHLLPSRQAAIFCCLLVARCPLLLLSAAQSLLQASILLASGFGELFFVRYQASKETFV
jgi:hypothetical protein